MWDISLILVGMIIQILIFTSLAGWMVGFQALGFDPVEEPTVEASVVKQQVSGSPGDPIRGFEDIRWKEGFELYHIVFNNQGPRTVSLKTDIHFPGCMIGYRKQMMADRVIIEQNEDVSINQGNISWRIDHCDQEIRVSQLPPDETASLTVLVNRFGTGYAGENSEIAIMDRKVSKHVNVFYSWDFYGRREGVVNTTVKNADPSYVKAHLEIADQYYNNNDTEGMIYHLSEAHKLSSSNPKVERRFGFALSRFGYERENVQTIREGRRHIDSVLDNNNSDAVAWYYKAVSHTYEMLILEDHHEIAKNYCMAKASLVRATNESAELRVAFDLESKLEHHNPGVNCNISVVG